MGQGCCRKRSWAYCSRWGGDWWGSGTKWWYNRFGDVWYTSGHYLVKGVGMVNPEQELVGGFLERAVEIYLAWGPDMGAEILEQLEDESEVNGDNQIGQGQHGRDVESF